MTGQDYVRLGHEAFEPFLKEFGFSMDEPTIHGREYCISFTSKKHSVQVAYEPGDDALFAYIFGCENGILSDIDDTTVTPRLGDLNKLYMSKVSGDEHAENYEFFKAVHANDEEEKLVLEVARELRLVLPKYLNEPTRQPTAMAMPSR